jgi:tRNA nucleotidyltransferase (CCA-adding enzyme)
MKDEVSNFLLKNKTNSITSWTNNEMRICSLKLRKNTDVLEFLSDMIRNNREIGIPKGLRNDIKKGFKLFFLNINKLKKESLYHDLVYDFIFKNAMIFEE